MNSVVPRQGIPHRRRRRRRGHGGVLLCHGLPDGLEELAQPAGTLWRRRADVFAYFDHQPSNGPTEAINGRLEALRRNALGFRNLIHYRIRSLLHCGNLARQIDAL
jgi:transposase